MSLAGQLTVVEDLTDAQRDQMFELMTRYYENVDRLHFESDLNEKQWVIRIVDGRSGALCGFSTQMLLKACVERQAWLALFSGDTIVDHRYWGSTALATAWGRLAFRLLEEHSDKNLVWFLITQGFRTYRFLPVFFKEFYPRYDTATPEWARSLIDALGRAKFPHSYDPDAGVVKARYGYYLRQGIADLGPRRLRDPHIRFFSERNAGHTRGDELCCIAPLSRSNFTRAAHRIIDAKDLLPRSTR